MHCQKEEDVVLYSTTYLVHINKGKDLHQNKPKVHQHFLPVPSTKKYSILFHDHQANLLKCTELWSLVEVGQLTASKESLNSFFNSLSAMGMNSFNVCHH